MTIPKTKPVKVKDDLWKNDSINRSINSLCGLHDKEAIYSCFLTFTELQTEEFNNSGIQSALAKHTTFYLSRPTFY